MKRFVVSALSAGFLAGLVIGCNPTGPTEKSSHSSGVTEKEVKGSGMHASGATVKETDSTKK